MTSAPPRDLAEIDRMAASKARELHAMHITSSDSMLRILVCGHLRRHGVPRDYAIESADRAVAGLS